MKPWMYVTILSMVIKIVMSLATIPPCGLEVDFNLTLLGGGKFFKYLFFLFLFL